MEQVCECPFGVEDGHIVGYRARNNRLEVEYEFWNERRGIFVFDEYVGVRDLGAVGVKVSAFSEFTDSDFLESLLCRHYDIRPETIDWKHYCFFDVSDGAMFDVVGPRVSFIEGTLT